VDTLREARAITDIVSVQNLFNLTDRSATDVLEECEREGLGFLPWSRSPPASSRHRVDPLDEIGERTGATPAQLALAWLLHTSPVVLPIPGTKTLAHLEDNVAAAEVRAHRRPDRRARRHRVTGRGAGGVTHYGPALRRADDPAPRLRSRRDDERDHDAGAGRGGGHHRSGQRHRRGDGPTVRT
jgi:hypothetical protein